MSDRELLTYPMHINYFDLIMAHTHRYIYLYTYYSGRAYIIYIVSRTCIQEEAKLLISK